MFHDKQKPRSPVTLNYGTIQQCLTIWILNVTVPWCQIWFHNWQHWSEIKKKNWGIREVSDLLKGEVKKIKSLCLTTTVLGRYTDTFSSSLYQYQFRRKCKNESQAKYVRNGIDLIWCVWLCVCVVYDRKTNLSLWSLHLCTKKEL